MAGLRTLRTFAALAGLALCVSGCGTVPKDGPYKSELTENASATLLSTDTSLPYALVHLNPSLLKILSVYNPDPRELARLPHVGGSQDVRISVGDMIGLTIFEQDSGGLFIPKDAGSRAGNFVSIPMQQIDKRGTIDVPYAGAIQAAGRTTSDVANDIKTKLKSRAIDPQVVVSFGERHGAEVSVLGDVSTSTRFELDPNGIQILGAIARAGGPKDPPYETTVSLQRGGRSYQATLTSIVKDPAQNIQLAPGDVVFVTHEPKVFITLGATLPPGSVGGINSRRFIFDNDRVSLTEAVSKSGGLNPDRADATAVFIIRSEPRDLLAKMGVDVSVYKNKQTIPTIYAADWSRADAFFLSNNFAMRDKDVIFVSEHPTTDLNKLTAAIRGVTSPIYDLSESAVSANTIR